MKKRLLILTLGLLLMGGAVRAQIFLQEGDENNMRDVTMPVNAWPENPPNSQGNDYYLPLGDGILLLAALGGAYLVGKRKHFLQHRA